MKKTLSLILCITLLFTVVTVNYITTNAQVGDKFVFEAEGCYDKNNTTSSIGSGSGSGWNEDCSARVSGQTFLVHGSNSKGVLGDYITFNLGELELGSYDLYFGYRVPTGSTRCTYKIEAWDSSNTVQSAGDDISFMAISGTNIQSLGSYFFP